LREQITRSPAGVTFRGLEGGFSALQAGRRGGQKGIIMTTTTTPTTLGGADLLDLLASYELSLRAGGKGERTLEAYSDSIHQLVAFLKTSGMPTDPTKLLREHIEMFEADLFARGRKPATVSVRHRALSSFFKWCAAEREIAASPMANMPPPIVPEQPVPVPRDDDLKRLLSACDGQSLERVRDAALVRFLIDTGVRASEAIDLRVADVDVYDRNGARATVLGKGRRSRAVPIGAKTAKAIDKYLRARRSHPHSGSDYLWLSSKGRLTTSGLRQLLERRCDQAGIRRIHPHQLRHAFAHSWLSQNGAEVELMQLTGWRSRAMLQRYAASTLSERAVESHRRLSPADKL
jgi:site-specific recombinase XerD